MRKGYTAFVPGDVIMAKITPCMENGKTTVVPELAEGICFGSTEFHVIRPESGIAAQWVAQFLLQHDVRRAAQRQMGGAVGQMRVPTTFLETVRIPVPPSAEQRRICDVLDELLSDLDAGVAALERVKAKLALYRASVLKAATEGTLTAEWREQHPDVEPSNQLLARILAERRRSWEEEQLRRFKDAGREPPKNWKARYKEPIPPDTSGLAQLPHSWCWASLDEIGALDRGRSRHRPRDAEFLYGGPFPFIQTGDVKRARQYVREHQQTYTEAGLEQSRLWPSDTLCITIAANIAETAILAYPACFPDSVVGVEFEPELVAVRYVEFFLRSVKDVLGAYAPATAQKNINNEILRSLAIALPPFEEQQTIVDVLECQLSLTDHLEDDFVEQLGSAQALRQAILRHAFTGKLVLQDPNDEPAAELLKRIAVEREARAKAPRASPPRHKPRSKHRTAPASADIIETIL